MVSQERAERTRGRLLEAAAREFSLQGYSGTSLQRISRSAGVTMGALTFHFPTKPALAEAVHARGSEITREAVARTGAEPPEEPDHPLLQRVIRISHTVAALLCEEPTVRAAGRLTREGAPGPADWTDSWLPDVRGLLDQASREKELRTGVDPEIVALLLRYLILGVLDSPQPTEGCASHLARLNAVWAVLLTGLIGNAVDAAQAGDGSG
ncbi:MULTISPECIES: TetR/AcrR family transcriptional regulator [Streptomyces]|uniref:TetR/AcrR family transcriptional regulator n=1 Tax=Streptomyces TaxID=1883 RepID=UPI0004C6C034|nr:MULTISPECIES: TetR/AcrR family transcriptional regulator [unclassified Streptomyces]KOV75647.1 gamma-butyrolactone receptor protein [Streptomyces sp. NRRL WC-3723]